MHSFYAFLFLLSLFTSALAQETTTADKQQMVDQITNEGLMGAMQTYDNRYEGVKGSPFLSEDWQTGSFELTDGTVYQNLPLRYDLLGNELWFRNQVKMTSIVPQDRLRKFSLESTTADEPLLFTKAKYFESLTDELDSDKIVQIVYDGDFTVVAVRYKAVKQADYQGGYSKNQTYDEIVDIAPKYFIIREGQEAERLKPKKKSIQKAFPEHAEQLVRYLNEQKLDLTEPSNLAQLFGVLSDE